MLHCVNVSRAHLNVITVCVASKECYTICVNVSFFLSNIFSCIFLAPLTTSVKSKLLVFCRRSAPFYSWASRSVGARQYGCQTLPWVGRCCLSKGLLAFTCNRRVGYIVFDQKTWTLEFWWLRGCRNELLLLFVGCEAIHSLFHILYLSAGFNYFHITCAFQITIVKFNTISS